MSRKATCPVCESHTSDNYSAFEREDDCPNCKTSFDTIQKINDIRLHEINMKRQAFDKKLVEENNILKEKLVMAEEVAKTSQNRMGEILDRLEDLLKDLGVYVND
jgi:transcriptional regulator NrdR family protein